MELNSKKLERISRLVYYSISLALCFFLILLSSRIIDDLDSATPMPEVMQFEDATKIGAWDKEIAAIQAQMDNVSAKMETIRKTMEIAQQNYANEKESFDNWLQARSTLGSPDKDQEVLARANQLDEYYKVEQNWRQQLADREAEIAVFQQKQSEIQQLIDQERNVAYERYNAEMKQYELKVFLIRLMFVAPILALGIFFFIRFRNHQFWPLFLGFSFFSLYAFFVGLVPYLPSYGGYVRNTVGVFLSIGLGYYAIKTIRQYIQRKEAQLKVASSERAKNVRLEVAEKALANHYCPSCGKDFLVKKWDAPLKSGETELYKMVTDFCRHCGLELFAPCKQCGTKNFAHLPYCAACGTSTVEK